MTNTLADTTWLITGASRGIGAATAAMAAKRGARVFINYRHNHDSAQAVVQRCRAEGGEAVARASDVSVEADVVAMFAQAMSTKRGGAGGSIINVSSAAAYLGSPNEYVDYAATKGAMDTMTIGLAKELAAEGIRVNAVRPGLIETDIHEGDRLDRLKGNVPLQRAGEADEVAETILFLASPAASYVTGSLLNVSGGR